MAIKKTGKSSDSARPMDYQGALQGNSRATRTCRITFSTTQEIGDAVENAAYDRHMNKSRLIEQALIEFLGFDK